MGPGRIQTGASEAPQPVSPDGTQGPRGVLSVPRIPNIN